MPLLVLWLGYGHREATGTSLAAIAIIGAFAAAAHGLYGNVELGKGLLVAAPAIGGVLAGTALQQRVSGACRGRGVRRPAARLGGGARLLMDALDLTALVALGFVAGVTGGLLGVGGGIVFVPALAVFAHLTQLEAVATSLVAIVLVAVVGTVRQREYGNVRLRDGLLIGVLSPLGVVAGVVLANALPERALELSFAGLQVAFALQLARNAVLR